MGGAVTWVDSSIGTRGVVSLTNSLMGGTDDDQVGRGIYALANGNYVVRSFYWDNGSKVDVGSITWCNGTTGVSGFVSEHNSLIGSTAGDKVGTNLRVLANGNYVLGSPTWDKGNLTDVGAVTWVDGTTGVSGFVSEHNSLIGSTSGDQVGTTVRALSNGNYFASSTTWDKDTVADVGAVTWGNGTTSTSGTVSELNSLTGSVAGDKVGTLVNKLTNGNYVVHSASWSNGSSAGVGAATWGNGDASVSGVVGEHNSLIGATAGDQVGTTVTALSDGNYVVTSPNWDKDGVENVGAATWGNGVTGVSGIVSGSNSLIGTTAGDQIGTGPAIIDFPSSDMYAVRSYYFGYNGLSAVGAVTFVNKKTGVSGKVNPCNSVIGTVQNGSLPLVVSWNSVYGYPLFGYSSGNFVVAHRASTLPSSDVSDVQTIEGSTALFSDNCAPIATVTPGTLASSVTGKVTAKLFVKSSTQTVGGDPYVRRYFEITPEINPDGATGKVTLYFTQADFDDFNNERGSFPSLPSGPDDEEGKINLRISQHHGTSSTGEPGSYTGWTGDGPSLVLIDPLEKDIIWNSFEKRWEVTFAVTGFSGFFVHTSLDQLPLPVTLISFSVTQTDNAVVLKWETASEINVAAFEVERSFDGRKFIKIGEVAAKGSSSEGANYTYTDVELPGLRAFSYYRLKLVDRDGSYGYSKLISLKSASAFPASKIFPNPIPRNQQPVLEFTDPTGEILVTDLLGRDLGIPTTRLTPYKSSLGVDRLPPGIYFITVRSANGVSTQKLVIQ